MLVHRFLQHRLPGRPRYFFRRTVHPSRYARFGAVGPSGTIVELQWVKRVKRSRDRQATRRPESRTSPSPVYPRCRGQLRCKTKARALLVQETYTEPLAWPRRRGGYRPICSVAPHQLVRMGYEPFPF